MGVNAAGLRSKLNTFKKVLIDLQPSVFFIEESKYRTIGQLKLNNFIIFELVRQNKEGGGLALGCAKELQPVWLREGDDQVEALSVEIVLKTMKIRCVVAYGCQETDSVERKDAFWKYLDEDVYQANMSGSGFVLQFDGNLWAGNSIIPGDPRPQNRNGKLFQEFLSRNPQLSVVNALPQCEGLLTRVRNKNGETERSVLDFFVVCDRVLPFVQKMVIDERNKHVLTNYQNVKRGGKAKDSDHCTQYMDLDLKFESERPERVEMYDFKNKDGQEIFKKLTSETNELSNCFTDESPILSQVQRWRDLLEVYFQKSFRKIRIRNKKMKPLKDKVSNLIDERNMLMSNSNDPETKSKIEEISQTIADEEAAENRSKLIENFKDLSEDPENINIKQMWKSVKRIWPKSRVTEIRKVK